MNLSTIYFLNKLRTENVELLYSITLIISFFLSIKIPSISIKNSKRSYFCSFIGFSILLILNGVEIYHYIICSLTSFLLAHMSKSHRKSIAFVFSFSFLYIAVLRYLSFFNIYSLIDPVNITFLMLLFKLVNFAHIVEDPKKYDPPATLENFIHFICFFPGVWSGPYIDFTAIYNCLNNPKTQECQYKGYIMSRTIETFPYFLAYIILPFFVRTSDVFTPSYTMISPLWKFLTIMCIMLQVRSKYISAWYASEITCILAGAAYNPNYKDNIDSSIIYTVDTKNVMFATSIKAIGRAWNRTVQMWLVTYVYKRINLKLKLFKKVIVLLVSAFWHGIDSGYFISFLLFGFAQASQDLLWEKKWPFQNYKIFSFIFSILQWAITQSLITFCTIPYVYKTDFWKIWKELNFFGVHIMTTLFVVYCACHASDVRGNFSNKKKKIG